MEAVTNKDRVSFAFMIAGFATMAVTTGYSVFKKQLTQKEKSVCASLGFIAVGVTVTSASIFYTKG